MFQELPGSRTKEEVHKIRELLRSRGEISRTKLAFPEGSELPSTVSGNLCSLLLRPPWESLMVLHLPRLYIHQQDRDAFLRGIKWKRLLQGLSQLSAISGPLHPLSDLDLSNWSLESRDIPLVWDFRRLEVVNLSYNRITQLPPSPPPLLQVLLLSSNPLLSLRGTAERLQGCSKLTRLSMEDTPLQKLREYRVKVLSFFLGPSLIPGKLQLLDTFPIPSREWNMAGEPRRRRSGVGVLKRERRLQEVNLQSSLQGLYRRRCLSGGGGAIIYAQSEALARESGRSKERHEQLIRSFEESQVATQELLVAKLRALEAASFRLAQLELQALEREGQGSKGTTEGENSEACKEHGEKKETRKASESRVGVLVAKRAKLEAEISLTEEAKCKHLELKQMLCRKKEEAWKVAHEPLAAFSPEDAQTIRGNIEKLQENITQRIGSIDQQVSRLDARVVRMTQRMEKCQQLLGDLLRGRQEEENCSYAASNGREGRTAGRSLSPASPPSKGQFSASPTGSPKRSARSRVKQRALDRGAGGRETQQQELTGTWNFRSRTVRSGPLRSDACKPRVEAASLSPLRSRGCFASAERSKGRSMSSCKDPSGVELEEPLEGGGTYQVGNSRTNPKSTVSSYSLSPNNFLHLSRPLSSPRPFDSSVLALKTRAGRERGSANLKAREETAGCTWKHEKIPPSSSAPLSPTEHTLNQIIKRHCRDQLRTLGDAEGVVPGETCGAERPLESPAEETSEDAGHIVLPEGCPPPGSPSEALATERTGRPGNVWKADDAMQSEEGAVSPAPLTWKELKAWNKAAQAPPCRLTYKKICEFLGRKHAHEGSMGGLSRGQTLPGTRPAGGQVEGSSLRSGQRKRPVGFGSELRHLTSSRRISGAAEAEGSSILHESCWRSPEQGPLEGGGLQSAHRWLHHWNALLANKQSSRGDLGGHRSWGVLVSRGCEHQTRSPRFDSYYG